MSCLAFSTSSQQTILFNCKKKSQKIKKAIAIHKKSGITIAIIIKVGLNCNEYWPKMQDLSSRKEVMAQAVKELSEVEGIKVLVLHCQLHGVDKRKKLVSRDLIYSDFPLIRVLITYQYGKKRPIITQSRLIYPNNVYPYGRKTLELLEDIANQRYVEGTSWKYLGDIFYERYDFSVENLKRAIIRVNVAFNRLLAVGLIQSLNIVEWRLGEGEGDREGERRSFITLSFLYREKLFFGVFGAKLDISSNFDLFCK